MSDALSRFTERLYEEWLPSFCESRPQAPYSIEGFRPESIQRLTEFDATWFMAAVDAGVVSHDAGFFQAPRSGAKEQLFWTGSRKIRPQPITLWVEPVITIGAVGRLRVEFGWPAEHLGMQSSGNWAFDAVGYDSPARERLVVEVKKSDSETDTLIELMSYYAGREPVLPEPARPREKNAYRKVEFVRARWPDVVWALGPSGRGSVFEVRRDGPERFELFRVDEKYLTWSDERYP